VRRNSFEPRGQVGHSAFPDETGELLRPAAGDQQHRAHPRLRQRRVDRHLVRPIRQGLQHRRAPAHRGPDRSLEPRRGRPANPHPCGETRRPGRWASGARRRVPGTPDRGGHRADGSPGGAGRLAREVIVARESASRGSAFSPTAASAVRVTSAETPLVSDAGADETPDKPIQALPQGPRSR